MSSAPVIRGPIVVTGATGFIGRKLVRALLGRGVAVRALIRDPARWGAPEPGLSLHPFDLVAIDDAAARRHLEGASAVCHVAAYLPTNYQDPAFADMCLRVNALGTLGLLQAAMAAGIPRFVHLSSGNVYLPQSRAVTEDDPLYPSPRAPYYLASKVCGEVWVDHFRRTRDLGACVLRVSSVYGAGMAGGMVPTFTTRLRANERVTLQDGGRFRADLVHVDDVVEAAIQAASRGVQGIFNVGSGRDATALEVVSTLAELLGRDMSLVDVELAKPGEPSFGFSALDITRARATLGYAPLALRDGLARYLAS